MLEVSEIFFSLQGESSFAGLPCSFIRLSGCNLNCNYCDTRYAFETGSQMDIEQIIEQIGQLPCQMVEITGGEPLCQKDAIPLMQRLLDSSYQVLLETNGSIDIGNVPADVIRIVDVKLPGSGCDGSFLTDNLKHLCPTDELKFVISDRIDYIAAKDFLESHHIPTQNILFSPVSERIAPKQLADWILKDSLRVRFQIQLHKMAGFR